MFKRWMQQFCLLVVSCSFVLQAAEVSVFEWGSPRPRCDQPQQLKELWISSLVQECVRSQLEKELAALGIAFNTRVETGLLPCRFFLSVPEKQVGMEDLKVFGEASASVFREGFQEVVALWSQWVFSQKEVAYCPSGFKEIFSGAFSYEEFLEASAIILQDLRIDDLLQFFSVQKSGWAQPSKQDHALVSWSEEKREVGTFLPQKKGWEPSPDSVKFGEPKSEEAKLFFNLRLNDEDKANIRKLITSMSDKNVLQLLMDKKSMERRGDEIRPVHPMRFIGFVLADPNLRRCMKSVSKTMFKWSGFLDGFEDRMKEEAKAGNLNKYVPGLADYLGVDRNVIQRYINQGNYEGLVKHFL